MCAGLVKARAPGRNFAQCLGCRALARRNGRKRFLKPHAYIPHRCTPMCEKEYIFDNASWVPAIQRDATPCASCRHWFCLYALPIGALFLFIFLSGFSKYWNLIFSWNLKKEKHKLYILKPVIIGCDDEDIFLRGQIFVLEAMTCLYVA